VPLSLTGSTSYIIDEAHFTEQECNITADGTLNVCCPVKFKEGFNFDGDICDLDGKASFKSFAAYNNNGYTLLNSGATCAVPGLANKALVGIDGPPSSAIPMGENDSTKLQCDTGVAGSSNVTIFNPSRYNDDRIGIQINGSTLSYVADIIIKTNYSSGNILIEANQDLSNSAQRDFSVLAGRDITLTCGATPGSTGSFVGTGDSPFANLYSRRVNISNGLTLPVPGAGVIPLMSVAGGYPGDKLGDMVIGSDYRIYLCIASYVDAISSGFWYRLVNSVFVPYV
jgi:hypothetical protein